MQLTPGPRPSALRLRLGAAACLLLASAPAARAQTADTTANVFEASALLYGEKGRTNVMEPTAKITHLFGNGQALSAQLGLDLMTGASPTGAIVATQMQTVTSASGGSSTTSTSQLPTAKFSDLRGVLDLGWQSPIGRYLRNDAGGHFSREKDYQSLGWSEQLSLDLMQRRTTLIVGAGANRDGVFPKGGTPLGLSPTRIIVSYDTQPKDVAFGTVGLSQILTRRWMLALDGSRTRETGYLTEPYKIVSLVSPDSAVAVGQVTEKRPSERWRNSVTGSSVYHFEENVLYMSYRYYWDDWSVRSHTVDARYRYELGNQTFLQPHVRLYTQTQASFFTFGLPNGAPLPTYASADQRLGPLHSFTLGATYGVHLPNHPGELTVRAEWIHQWGSGPTINGPPVSGGEDDSGPQQVSLFPALDIGTLVVGYTLGF